MARLLRRHLYAATVILFGFGNFFLAKAITDSSVVISCVTPPAGLIDWWPGDNSAIDIQGGRNGTLINGAGFAAGKVQAAFNLNTSQQYQYVDVGAVPLPISFTIDAWINPSDLSNSPQIISGDGHLLTVLNNGTLQLTVTSIAGSTVYQTAASIVSTSNWQHVAATYDGNALAGQKINFYVNGLSTPASVVSSFDNGGTPNNFGNSTLIGIEFPTAPNFFIGGIDELELFNRVLSGSEIASIYNADSAGECKTVQFYVSSQNRSTIEKFAADGTDLGTFADASSGLNRAEGLAFDSAGNLYAASLITNQIIKFDPLGNSSTFAGTGLNGPVGLAFDATGNLYAANFNNSTIEKFSNTGTDLGAFVSRYLNGPAGLAFDSGGILYVANYNGNFIDKFGPAGDYLGAFALSGLSRPIAIAFDPNGTLFATNFYDSTIEKFDSSGNPTLFASTGANPPYNGPSGLAFDPDGNLYAANNTASTIEQFDPAGNAKLFAQYNSDPNFIAIQLLSPTASSIQFSSPSYSANETGGSVSLTVTRNGDVSGSATVHYATADGTATSPDDYSAAAGDLSFDPNETSKTIQIPLNEQADPANEDNEPNPWTFSVTLNNANGAMLSGPATATVTIIDDDAASEPTPTPTPTPCDTNPPVISVPSNIATKPQKKKVNGQKGAFVSFRTTAFDPEDGSVSATANPPSGSFFLVGTMTVSVTATDHCNNNAVETFTVTVKKK